MKIHSFSNFFIDAFKNITFNKIMSLATLITLAAGLFLFGLSAAFTINVFSITDKLAGEFKIIAYIDDSVPKENYSKIEAAIKDIGGISSIKYVSSQEAFSNFSKDLGDSDILTGLDDDFLPNSFEIIPTDIVNTEVISFAVSKINGIKKISNIEELSKRFIAIAKKLQLGTIILSLILASLSILIITNTINLSIFNRRKQINIMKYIGATDWYIRWPFILEGSMLGIIAAALSFLGSFYVYKMMVNSTGIYTNMLGIVSINDVWMPMLAITLSVGLFLGVFSSFISVRKHLKV